MLTRAVQLALCALVGTLLAPLPPSTARPAAARADLVVAKLSEPPARVLRGQAFRVVDRIRNGGRAAAGRTLTRYYLSTDARPSRGDLLVGSRTVRKLRPGQKANGAVTLRIPTNARYASYRLIACADARKRVKERKETNNCRASRGRVAVTARPRPPVENPVDPPGLEPTPIDPTVPTDFEDSVEFLYRGEDAVQQGVAEGAIDDDRVAVLRGRVLDASGAPVSLVRVTVLGESELGHTYTRKDGAFDIAVNGGGAVTLDFQKDGLLPVQRAAIEVPWQDFVVLDDVVMSPLDDAATVVAPEDASAPVVAAAERVTDEAGTRQAVLLFEPGTEAEMTLPDGTTRSLEQMTVRATEYTVGEEGPQRMPAMLPPTSGYTYAAEFSIDEAVEAGATSVEFSKPVVNYLENYLGMPVGVVVPSGYYDREKGHWVAGRNGRVIAIVGETEGKADVDVDGDGAADTGETLGRLGLDDAERAQLAERYDVGQELWRVLVDHFTPWDHNFPYGPAEGATQPEEPRPLNRRLPPDDERPCTKTGSIIGCQSQTLGESVPVTGTDYSLDYSSGRAVGRTDAYVLEEIPVVGANPGPLVRATLWITVAGRTFKKDFSPTPNQTYTFAWDGLDAYGRRVVGEQAVTVVVDYHYPMVYYATETEFERAFGRLRTETGTYGVNVSSLNRDDMTMTLTSSWRGWLGTWRAPVGDLGGWSLSAHHVYDPASGTLHLGDGSSRRADTLDVLMQPYSEETLALLGWPETGDVDAQGRLYVTENTRCHCVRRVDGPNQTTIIAGGATAGYSGDGGPATQAQLDSPLGVAVAPDGTVYVSDYDRHVVRRIDPDGVITTIAGTGEPGFTGDGGPATEARLAYPRDLALGPDGSLYVVHYGDGLHGRIRRIATDGVITTVAGGGTQGPQVNGIPATSAQVTNPHSVAVGPDGSVYFSQVDQFGRGFVRRVTPAGDIETVAGGGSGGDGSDARAAALGRPYGIDVAPDGTLFIALREGLRVRSVAPDGIIRTVAGNGECCSSFAGVPARAAKLMPREVVVAPDGRLHVFAGIGPMVVGQASPRLSEGEITIPSSDGSQLYQFTRAGRHLRTINSVTLAVIQKFGYDDAGRLVSVEDANGRVTRIERDASGFPEAIVAPGGQRTTLTVDAAGHLASITNPAAETVSLVTSDTGLLQSYTDPMQHTSTFEYDAHGRLVKDTHPVLGEQTLARTNLDNGHRVVHTSAEGLKTVYEATRDVLGRATRTTTDPAGGRTVLTERPDGSTSVAYPDGSTVTARMTGDSRWGVAAGYHDQLVTKLPSGRTVTVQRRKWVQVEQGDPLAVQIVYDRMSVNGREETYQYDVRTGEVVHVSAAGVRTESKVDAQGRVLETVTGTDGVPTVYTYDDLGRPKSVAQGDQRQEYAYDAKGRIVSVTDGLGHVTRFTWDDADRLKTRTLPGTPTRTYTFGYDANGNRTSITMPNGQVHTLAHSPRGQLTGYRPGAGLPGLVSDRDRDGRVRQQTLPDGSTLVNAYDDGGRLAGTAYTEADLHFSYLAQSEVVDVLTRTPAAGAAGATAQVLDLDHDGTVLTRAAASGSANGTYTYTHDDNAFLTGISLSSGSDTRQLSITRDADGMITKAGDFAWARTAIGRRVATVGDGTFLGTYSYDGTRRFTGRADTVGGAAGYQVDLTYDAAGLVASKTEKIGDAAAVRFDYTYDETGQLETVKRNGELVESYGYDVNGNRTTPTATYDSQDRLLSLSGTAYTFDDNGFLTGRGSDEFTYSEKGELLSAKVGDTTVTYAYDAIGRMVARTEDGGTTEYLYGNPGQPFQVTASRSPDGVLTSLEYDEEGRLYALRRNGAVFYVSSDHLGTPRVVRDASGAVVATREYDAFGVPVEAGTTHPEFDVVVGFAGGIEDPVTGLVRFGFRDYDPKAGRWTSRDPALFEGGQANLYVYVNSSPVTLRDPTGLWCIGGSAYGGIGGGIQYCHKDGDDSLCLEIGFGLGVDAGLGTGDAAETGDEVGIEGKAVCGPGGLGVNCRLDNCGNAKCKGKGEVGPFTADTEGSVGLQPSLEGPEAILNISGRAKCSLQGKVYGKVCRRF